MTRIDMTKHDENLVGIASVFFSSPLQTSISSDDGWIGLIRLVAEYGNALTKAEPEDYDEAGLAWYSVIERVVDGIFELRSPEDAVKQALSVRDH